MANLTMTTTHELLRDSLRRANDEMVLQTLRVCESYLADALDKESAQLYSSTISAYVRVLKVAYEAITLLEPAPPTPTHSRKGK